MPLTAITSALVSSILTAISNAPAESPPVIDASTTAIRVDATGDLVGMMYPPENGLVQIGKVVFQLSPAAQIRNQRNFIVLPAYIQEPVPVRFKLDQFGNVYRVWMLSVAPSL